MKTTSLFSLVVLLHAGLIGILLVQPGCQTKPAPDAAATVAAPAAGVTQSPTKPAAKPLDPAFNSGLTPGSTVANEQPRRFTAPTRPATAPGTDSAAGGILQPAFTDNGVLQPLVGDGAMRSYTVKSGDTLTRIARAEGVTVADLRQANQMKPDATIYPGQQLIIPAPAAAAAPAASTAPTADAALTYVVQRGDSLSKIASQHKVTVAQIKSANRLTSDTIRVDQRLVIPQLEATPVTVAPAAPDAVPVAGDHTRYTIVSGDSPSKIAAKFGVPVAELMRLNKIDDPRRIQVGQTLLIPARTAGTPPPSGREPAATATTAPAAGNRTLVDRPSTPRVIGTPPPPAPSVEDLEALENADLPFVEFEVIPGN
jgi:LysM repeat protein